MIELKLISKFPHTIIATDEVGRGPLSGPVVAGAICLDIHSKEELKSVLKALKKVGIQDSKKLSTSKRLEVLKKLGVGDLPFRKIGVINIQGVEIHFVSWEMDHQVIDEENILSASLRAMREASEALSVKKKNPTTVLIDGNKKFKWGIKESPWTEIPIVKGDMKSLLIGLSSILAKEKRDSFMQEMHKLYPVYGFNTHAGYPTKEHRKAIELHGPSPIHRQTFKGVKEFIRS
jgi:ribonuclease HII